MTLFRATAGLVATASTAVGLLLLASPASANDDHPGGGHTPITICHKGQTMTTPDDDSLAGHLGHGDSLGPCAVATTAPATTAPATTAPATTAPATTAPAVTTVPVETSVAVTTVPSASTVPASVAGVTTTPGGAAAIRRSTSLPATGSTTVPLLLIGLGATLFGGLAVASTLRRRGSVV